MTVIHSNALIARPIEEVFDFTVDSRNEFEWNPRVRVMTKLTDGPVGLGTRMRAKWANSSLIELECSEYDRPYRWTWVNGGPIAVTLSVTLSEEAEGTRLRSRFDARPHGLARLFFPAFVYVMRKEEARNMTLLKTHLATRVPR